MLTFDKLDNNTKQVIGQLKLEKPTDVLFEGADTNIYKEVNEISPILSANSQRLKKTLFSIRRTLVK